MKNILIYGLQRSGTNFLETLLTSNFKVKVLNQNDEIGDRKNTLQKHFRLYDDKRLIPEPKYQNNLKFSNFSEYENTFDLTNQINGIVVISKDPYSWLLSYKSWGERCSWPSPDYHYVQEYNKFYEKWLEFSSEDNRIIFVRYIDLLIDGEIELQKIKKSFDLKGKIARKLIGNIKTLNQVSQSKKFDEVKYNYYVKEEYLQKYSETELNELNKILDENVLRKMSYQKRSLAQ